MTYFSLIILGVVVVLVYIFWLAKKDSVKHETSLPEEFMGICAIPLDATIKKSANLEKIIKMFGEKSELTNAEIRNELGVSSRTAVNYMDELERQDKVEQIGKIGLRVKYRLK